jgi:hypothetical protein
MYPWMKNRLRLVHRLRFSGLRYEWWQQDGVTIEPLSKAMEELFDVKLIAMEPHDPLGFRTIHSATHGV